MAPAPRDKEPAPHNAAAWQPRVPVLSSMSASAAAFAAVAAPIAVVLAPFMVTLVLVAGVGDTYPVPATATTAAASWYRVPRAGRVPRETHRMHATRSPIPPPPTQTNTTPALALWCGLCGLGELGGLARGAFDGGGCDDFVVNGVVPVVP